MLTVAKMTALAKQWAKEYWDLEFNVPIEISGRMVNMLGVYYSQKLPNGSYRPKVIRISKNYILHNSEETVLETLKHELCHWACQTLGKPFKDGAPYFERELRRIGSHSTRTVTAAGPQFNVKCSACGKHAGSRPTMQRIQKWIKPGSKYQSNCCGAKLLYSGQTFTRETYVPHSQNESGSQQRTADTSARTLSIAQITIKDIITPGKRGVTNAQMIPAIKQAISENSLMKLILLRNTYPEVYKTCVDKYLSKSEKTIVKNLAVG